jgi:MYXO-CTERM domain-containing protein
VKLADGSWRVFGIDSSGTGESCGAGDLMALIHPAVPWIEMTSGVDITPCTDADGTWNPSASCTGFSLAPDSTGRSWDDGCAEPILSGREATCGPPFGGDGGVFDAGARDAGDRDAVVSRDARADAVGSGGAGGAPPDASGGRAGGAGTNAGGATAGGAAGVAGAGAGGGSAGSGGGVATGGTAGAAGSGNAGKGGAGGSSGGHGDRNPPPDDTGGCSCRAAGSHGSHRVALVAFAMMALSLRRSRHQRVATSPSLRKR